ncbi:MAG: hypothetical protein GXO91_03035 [FCB group bacterium]|nr:hypothetical protein [FCB group bacterium]
MTEQFFKELRQLRESQKIELSEISERTNINPRYFESIEKGEFSVLPTVYMRLFLRSYAIEIGADPVKVLEDYELYTTGKIAEKMELKIQPAETTDSAEPQLAVDETPPFHLRKKIVYGVIAIIALFIMIKFVISLLEEQKSVISPVPVQTQPAEEASAEELTPAKRDTLVFSVLPPAAERTESIVYSPTKAISTNATKLPITPPYHFVLTALTKTKVHVSTPRRSLFNAVMSAGEVKQFDFSDTLRFDLWSARHIDASVNGVNLSDDQYLGHDDVAIRASIVTDGSLSVESFRH